ncbi:MAG: hypothetical protein MRZ92_04335 [Lactobacillus sp.]|uniref:hypothetical protein n=2 Tax=Limosilactobacillus coleohominis TaxID=181675 RepID=UPI002A90C8C7|nr:hypothetical protein [Limosilactobacillus coleohominis]MCI5812721.1 hypothetical protein [Lactobacillus sp.]MDY5628877.1 hypothetical protein [Limosilactobacillus coleohominis]
MKTTPKQKQLSELINNNMQFYAAKMQQLNRYSDSFNAEVYAHNITELVNRLNETVAYAKELEEVSYRVAEKEAGQYA